MAPTTIPAVAGLVAIALLAMPAASAAASIEVILTRNDGHPLDHPYEVAERRGAIPIKVQLRAKDFACAQPAKFTINAIMGENPDIATYGASPNPDSTTITIPVPGPGPNTKIYDADEGKDWILGIFWSEDRPKTGAKTTYTISSKDPIASPEGGPCLPPFSQTPAMMTLTVVGMDMSVPDGNATDPVCAADPSLCIDPGVAAQGQGGSSPSPGAWFMVVALVGALVLRRRRAG